MGDPAGEPAHGFHALGLEEPLLGTLQLGDVLGDSDEAHRPAGGVPHGRDPSANPPDGAIGADDPVGLAALLLASRAGEHRLEQAFPVLLMHGVEPAVGDGVGMLAAVPEDLLVCRAQVQ